MRRQQVNRGARGSWPPTDLLPPAPQVYVSDSRPAAGLGEGWGTLCGRVGEPGGPGAGAVAAAEWADDEWDAGGAEGALVVCGRVTTGRHVTIRLPGPGRVLTLCEVQVYGASSESHQSA